MCVVKLCTTSTQRFDLLTANCESFVKLDEETLKRGPEAFNYLSRTFGE